MMRHSDGLRPAKPLRPGGNGWKDAARHRTAEQRLPRPGSSRFDYLIVGAGFAGSVLAERLAVGAGKRVLLIDRRPHVGGNAFDEHNADGILVHRYGPHIFHTNSHEIAAYLSRFTEWRPYEHRVLAQVDGMLVPIPINLDHHQQALRPRSRSDPGRGLPRRPCRAGAGDPHLRGRGREPGRPRALREVLPRLYPEAVGRRPVRARQDGHRARAHPHLHRRPLFRRQLPEHAAHGYTRMFENMLDHRQYPDHARHRLSRRRGRGPLRQADLHRADRRVSSTTASASCPTARSSSSHETMDREWLQPVAVVNYPDERCPTRASPSTST